ncbi:hypothetical protein GVN22_27220 [Cellulophaga sp. BC115SP]|nr:hypothetical protein [Cellulophaga sp. BC115SP]
MKKIPSSYAFNRASVGSYVDKFGVIRYATVNTPRFTHNPLTKESLGILIEEEKINFVTNSITIISNSSEISKNIGQVAPDLSLDAQIVEKLVNSAVYFQVPMSVLSDGVYTKSIFVKANNNIEAILGFEGIGGDSSNGGYIQFNILSKQFSGNTSIALDYGYEIWDDGWLRVFVVCQKSSNKIVSNKFFIGGFQVNTTNNQSMYLWGSQIESGGWMSSYMPSNGISFNRKSDIFPMPKSEISSKEGTIVVNGVKRGKTDSTGGYRKIISLDNKEIVGYIPNDNIVSSDSSSNPMFSIPSSSGVDSIAITYNSFERKLSANGGPVILGSSNPDFFKSSTTSIYIGRGISSNYLNGTIKSIRFYSQKATDNQLIKLSRDSDLVSIADGGITNNNDLGSMAFMDYETLLNERLRQEFSIDGTGISQTRNIRRPFNFRFEIVDSSGVTLTAQPASSCTAGTDNALTFTAPLGKTLTYAITPVYEN